MKNTFPMFGSCYRQEDKDLSKMPYVLGIFLVICILNWSKSYHLTIRGILQ